MSLSTLLLMLAMHEDCQERVYQELLNIMPNSDVDLTPALINKMIYLDQCLRETQRLFPTVPLIGRAANETLNLKGYDIPPDTPIFIGIRQIHRRQDYYGPTAHLFDPDRFKPTEHHPKKEQQGIYLPFSLGQRNCIGKYIYCSLLFSVLLLFCFFFYVALFIKLCLWSIFFSPSRTAFNIFLFASLNRCCVLFLFLFFNAIGYSYAIYTMKLVAAHILRNYRLRTPLKLHELKVKLSISFRLLNKHLLTVQKRDN